MWNNKVAAVVEIPAFIKMDDEKQACEFWTGGTLCPPVRKRLYPIFYFFCRCPVCGEWCKLHWLLLDTLSFDSNTRRSRGHKMFKMAPTKLCAVEYAKTTPGAFAFA